MLALEVVLGEEGEQKELASKKWSPSLSFPNFSHFIFVLYNLFILLSISFIYYFT